MEPNHKKEIGQDEDTLIRQALRGNRSALEALFGRRSGALYQSALKLLGNPEDAEDALQDGMLSAFRNLRRFEGRSQFSTWLTRIVINAALMRLRAQRGRGALSIDDPVGESELTLADQLADAAPNPEEVCAREELREILDRNVRGLSPDMRTALRLRDVEGLSTREAAETLGVPENTLKSRLHRARLQLADRLSSSGAQRRAARGEMVPAVNW